LAYKNRNKIRAFYLKDYTNKEELNISLSRNGYANHVSVESLFDVKNYIESLSPSLPKGESVEENY
jgi:hypothetical protein